MRAFRLPALAVAVIMPSSSGHSWYEKLHPPHRPAFHRACAVSAFAGVSPLVFRALPCQIFGKDPSYPVGSPWGFRRLGRSRCTHQSGKDLFITRLCTKASPSARPGQDKPFRIRHTPCLLPVRNRKFPVRAGHAGHAEA